MNILLLDRRATVTLLENVQKSYGIREEDVVELVCGDRAYYEEVAAILKAIGYELDEPTQLWKRKGYDERGRKETT